MNKNIHVLNKKARHDFEILSELEAGVVLTGKEIKAIRAGKINMSGSYIKIFKNELYWVGAHISVKDDDSIRLRKLLLKKAQLNKIIEKSEQKQFTIVPVRGYFVRGKFKLEIASAKGKKQFDKRESLKKIDQQRDIEGKIKSFKNINRGY